MGEVEVMALRDATLKIFDGEVLVILGPSGSGKSTLLNLIGGMDRPTGGKVLYRDRDLGKNNDREQTMYRRYEVGFVFQFYNLVPTLTALENVEVVTEVARNPMSAREALSLVGLAHRHDHFPAQMSGGEQQRVAIARAIAGNPSILLCDEPTGALDIRTSREVLKLLLHFNRDMGKTLVIITHNAAICGIADRIAHIRDGAIAWVKDNDKRVPVEELDW
ncbi:ATP-binding cassette domain-containing protein [bacterium]|nr:ATP-binding cassette domain-containing protein [bacterium]